MNTSAASPFRTLSIDGRISVQLPQARSVVILVPHPDDEVLGCGLLIARLMRAGVRVTVIALTDGDASHPGSVRWPPALLARVRRAEMRRAMQRLGAARSRLHFMGWHDGRVGTEARPLRVAKLCHAAGAGLVLAASVDDHHPDHQACFQIGRGVARRLRLPLVSYAVWSRLSETAAHRRANRDRAAKNWAMAAHRSQISNYIADAPSGFRLSQSALAQFIAGPERYNSTTNPIAKKPHTQKEPD